MENSEIENPYAKWLNEDGRFGLTPAIVLLTGATIIGIAIRLIFSNTPIFELGARLLIAAMLCFFAFFVIERRLFDFFFSHTSPPMWLRRIVAVLVLDFPIFWIFRNSHHIENFSDNYFFVHLNWRIVLNFHLPILIYIIAATKVEKQAIAA